MLRDISYYLPLYEESVRRANRTTALVSRPLFPGYIFVNIPSYERTAVLEIPGILSFVQSRGIPCALESEEIERLREGLGRFKCRPEMNMLQAGEKVKIVNGPLQGFAGILIRQKSVNEVVISVEMIQRSVAVQIDLCDLQKLN